MSIRSITIFLLAAALQDKSVLREVFSKPVSFQIPGLRRMRKKIMVSRVV
jgi:hypothetical protein